MIRSVFLIITSCCLLFAAVAPSLHDAFRDSLCAASADAASDAGESEGQDEGTDSDSNAPEKAFLSRAVPFHPAVIIDRIFTAARSPQSRLVVCSLDRPPKARV